MPTYDYQCLKCGHSLEFFQKITESPLKQCPKCQKEGLKRGPGGGIGLSFKGKGFYITDYGPLKEKEKAKEPSTIPSKSENCPCGKEQKACSSERQSN